MGTLAGGQREVSGAASTAPAAAGLASIRSRIFENDFMTTSEAAQRRPRPPTLALAPLALPISKQPAFQRLNSAAPARLDRAVAVRFPARAEGPLAEPTPAMGDQADGGHEGAG